MGKAIIATTTLYGGKSDTRFGLALKTVEEAKRNGLDIIIIDGGSPAEVCQAMREKGAKVVNQEVKGFGLSIRQSLREASCLVGIDGVIIRLEAEKHTLVNMLPALVSLMLKDNIDLLKLGRKNRDDYPPMQKAAEGFAILACQEFTGLKWDFDFGPFLLSQQALLYFLQYDGEYGDLWESLDIPQLRIVRDGLNVKYQEVDYVHPPEQAGETGPDMIFKRLKQMSVQVTSIGAEAKKLGFWK